MGRIARQKPRPRGRTRLRRCHPAGRGRCRADAGSPRPSAPSSQLRHCPFRRLLTVIADLHRLCRAVPRHITMGMIAGAALICDLRHHRPCRSALPIARPHLAVLFAARRDCWIDRLHLHRATAVRSTSHGPQCCGSSLAYCAWMFILDVQRRWPIRRQRRSPALSRPLLTHPLLFGLFAVDGHGPRLLHVIKHDGRPGPAPAPQMIEHLLRNASQRVSAARPCPSPASLIVGSPPRHHR